MTLAEQITDYVHAAFSGLWLQSQELDEAEREIIRLARERRWRRCVPCRLSPTPRARRCC